MLTIERMHVFSKGLRLAALPAIAMAVVGCSTYSTERHYFKSVNEDTGEPVNYFRVTIKSSSELASSRYVSGYFDEEAVNQYFSEITGISAAKQKFPGTPSTNSSSATASQSSSTADSESYASSTEAKEKKPEKNERIESTSAEMQGRKLVILMSANSDQIADELGAFTDSQIISDYIGAIASKEAAIAANRAAFLRDNAVADANSVLKVAKANLSAGKLHPETVHYGASQEAVLEVVNHAASLLGAQAPFKDLNEASAWLQQNRTRLVQE